MTVRSALYLTGNKTKLIPEILPHLQDGRRTDFYDVFGGSGCVSLNVAKGDLFERVVYNERCNHLFELQESLKFNEYFIEVVEDLFNNTSLF